MALDETGGTEAVEQPQRVDVPPPPPPDQPGTPGSPSRAESRAAAQDNGQPPADQPKEQPSTSPPDSTDRKDNEPEGGQGQTEASPAPDRGGPAEQQDTGTAGGLDSSVSEAPDAAGDLENVDQDQVKSSGDAKRPSDGLPTVTEEQSTDAYRESSDHSATETEPQRTDNDTAPVNRPEANAPDQPLHRQAQETEQPTSESPDTNPDLPKPDTDRPGPTETPDSQTPTSDQLADPQTPPDQTEATANRPDGPLEASSDEDTERSTYKVPFQFVAESYAVPLAELEKLRDQRNREEPDSSGKEDDPTKPPTGEELLKPGVEGLSRRERLLREAYEDIDDVFDVAEKASTGAEHMLNLRPPTGHAEIVSGPEYHPAPHEGLHAGEITAGLLALGIVGGEGIRRVQRVLRGNRKA